MKEYKIVIDAGHGGDDPGAIGNGIIEKDLTLDISKYMYNQFRKLGIPTTLIRTDDETLNPTERVERILDAYGSSNDVIVISNHINAGGGDGAEVIYALRNNNNLANLILNSIEATGQNVRKAYQRRLPSNTAKDYYFIHRNTGNTQPIIVEYGFLDSKEDDVNQLKNNYEEYAQAVVDAVAEYIGLNVSDNYYTVVSGDSLWSIAKKLNTTVNELKEANNLTSNNLSIGQILIIPEKDKPTNDTSIYTVISGDSLYKIANKFNTTINELKTLNNLTSNNLSIGQILKIPSNEETSNSATYVVVSGDSLYKIANKFNTTVDELKTLNNLTSNNLSIGQIINIPSTESSNYTTYIVVKGDNLYSIARKFNTTQDELMKINNLSSNLLSIGQTLRIPTNNQTYTVVKGDSLYSIANKFNTTVDRIKTLNNLTTNTLQIGQILKI